MCKAIFILKELDLAGVVESFALLKSPKMPELKALKLPEIELPDDLKLEKIPFSDKVREKARLKRLELGPLTDKKNHKNKKADSWTKQKELKEKKDKRKQKKVLKSKFISKEKGTEYVPISEEMEVL